MNTNKGFGDMDYIVGHVNGELFFVTNTVDQIAAFIIKHRFKSIVLTDAFDQLLLNTSMGFVDRCPDQEFLSKRLLPVLVPMQKNEVQPIEFIPHKIEEDEPDFDDGVMVTMIEKDGTLSFEFKRLIAKGFKDKIARLILYNVYVLDDDMYKKLYKLLQERS